MVHKEAPETSTGLFSCHDFYNRAVAALLATSPTRSGGDGHVVTGTLAIHHADETVTPGMFRLTDKYSYDSLHYDLERYPTSVHPEEQRRLLQIGASVLYLQLRTRQPREVHSFYELFWPQQLRPGSDTYTSIYPEEVGEQPLTDMPPSWPADKPYMHRVEDNVSRTVWNPSVDHNLAQIYKSLDTAP